MSCNSEEKPPIILPFEGDDFDIGTWAYTHRIGLCVTLIIYLLLAIGFMTAKITLELQPQFNSITVDLQQLAELERQRDELKKSVEELQQMNNKDWRSVQNLASNQNSTSQQVRDDRNTDVDRLLKDAEEFQRQMAENRANYENGVAEAEAIKSQRSTTKKKSDKSKRRDAKVAGNVTVSYSFTEPIRHAQRLVVPAYQCEGGGEVVVNIIVNRGGEVTSAKISSGGDDCMQQTALSAAQSSLFNVDTSAPSRHAGVITYIFVPQ